MLPNFLGIGAPKAGTTWLFENLRVHPEIYLPPQKELYFLDYGQIDGRLQEYEAVFSNAGGAKAVGEITTGYLASSRVPGRVRKILPEARIFVSLRHPAEQVYSHYWHLRGQNFHQWYAVKGVKSFEEAIDEYSDLLLRPARYWEHLQRWSAAIGRDRIHVILFDDIRSDPNSVLREMYRFLGVDSSFRPKREGRVRGGGAPRVARLEAIELRAYAWVARGPYQWMKQRLGVRAAEEILIRSGLRTMRHRLFRRKNYPPMDPSTRRRLVDYFSDQVDALEEFTGRGLSAWRR